MDITPTIAGFAAFLQGVVGIPQTVLGAANVQTAISDAYQVAFTTTNDSLAQAPGPLYANAVYCLGTDWLLNWAPDPPNGNYFTKKRKELKLTAFQSGVVSSSGDEGTNVTLEVIEAAKNLTFDDLQRMKTVYGRQYIAIAQKYGTLWGSS